MSYICSICMESLVYDPKPNSKSCKYGKITSTKCGHVFHGECIQQWFEKIKQNNSNTKEWIPKSCPICQREISPRDCKVVFPTEDTELTNPNKNLQNGNIQTSRGNTPQVPDLCKLPSSISLTNKSTTGVRNPFVSASQQQTKSIETSVKGLSKGDIVVWFLEGGDNKEIGSVIWIGTINGIIHACVKFISPIGDSSKEAVYLRDYDSKYCKMIPIGELVLYLDCFGYDGVEK